jgi:hypothetical protein
MRALNTIGLWSIGIMRTGAVEWSLEFFVVIGRVVKGTAQTKQNGFGNLRRLCAPATIVTCLTPAPTVAASAIRLSLSI